METTPRAGEVSFTAAGARLIGADGAGWGVVERGLRRAAVGLAAEQAGGAQWVQELMVEHARTRHQFGRPIGSFQAVQHLRDRPGRRRGGQISCLPLTASSWCKMRRQRRILHHDHSVAA